MEEFDRCEDLAQAFGVELAEEAVDIARDDLHEVQAEREAERHAKLTRMRRATAGAPVHSSFGELMFGTLG